MDKIITPRKKIIGEFKIPGDKSISHRAVMFGAISKGVTEISGFLTGDDCFSTIDCFSKLGVEINVNGNNVKVIGKGLRGLSEPKDILDVGNSGTTIRLISGLLAGQDFSSELTGDESIQKRPMDRIFKPLREMDASITGKDNTSFAPIKIMPSNLKGINYTLPIASAQVKSSILLASLYASGETIINEPIATRDHTEIMLNYLGANIQNKNGIITSSKVDELYAKPISVPSDISSAAFFIVAGLIIPDSDLIIKNVGINNTRIGIITALKQMGGYIELFNKKIVCGEAVADIHVKHSLLNSSVLSGEIIPKMIDEVPIFAVAALFAKGTTIIKNAEELKVKESNRINAMVTELKKMGAKIEETDDGMIIQGENKLCGARVQSYKDHRIAMSLAIAALAADTETSIEGASCVNISFPNFFDYL